MTKPAASYIWALVIGSMIEDSVFNKLAPYSDLNVAEEFHGRRRSMYVRHRESGHSQ